MTARSGMANLISSVRGLANAGSADFTLVKTGGTISFFDDSEIQRILDRNRVDIYREPLEKFPDYTDGTTHWFVYQSKHRNLEGIESGTALFRIEDGVGNNIGSASYTADYAKGRFVFYADTGGTPYYLTARAYDLYKSAADVWRAKAGLVADRFDIRTDTQKFSRSQLIAQYLEMALTYDNHAGPGVINVGRDDGVVLGD